VLKIVEKFGKLEMCGAGEIYVKKRTFGVSLVLNQVFGIRVRLFVARNMRFESEITLNHSVRYTIKKVQFEFGSSQL